MSKLIKTFEKGIDKTELHFFGGIFTLTMMPTDYGAHSVEKGLTEQVNKYFDKYHAELDTESDEMVKVFNAIDMIDCDDNGYILDDLKILDEFEMENNYAD